MDEPQGVSLGDGTGFEHAKVKTGAVGCLHEPRQFFHAPARGDGGAGSARLGDLYAQIVELVDVAEMYFLVGEPFEGEVFEEGSFGKFDAVGSPIVEEFVGVAADGFVWAAVYFEVALFVAVESFEADGDAPVAGCFGGAGVDGAAAPLLGGDFAGAHSTNCADERVRLGHVVSLSRLAGCDLNWWLRSPVSMCACDFNDVLLLLGLCCWRCR